MSKDNLAEENYYYDSLSRADQQMVEAFYQISRDKQVKILEKAFKFMLRDGKEDDAKRILVLHKRIKETSNGFDFTLDDDVRTLLMAKELVSSLMVPIALEGPKMSKGKTGMEIHTPMGGGTK